jgi:hypothetical protein
MNLGEAGVCVGGIVSALRHECCTFGLGAGGAPLHWKRPTYITDSTRAHRSHGGELWTVPNRRQEPPPPLPLDRIVCRATNLQHPCPVLEDVAGPGGEDVEEITRVALADDDVPLSKLPVRHRVHNDAALSMQ